MISFCRTTLILIVIATLPALATAGKMTEDLAVRAASAPADQMVKVWIKAASAKDGSALRAAASVRAETRTERYQAARSELRVRHENSQRPVIEILNRLQASQHARNIKGHWLVNIIEAEVAASELQTLAERTDIELILAEPEIQLIAPDPRDDALSLATANTSDNLRFINADDAWAAGYTGQGRLVCSFDTGIDGAHPALSESWKGNDGDHAAAWFDTHEGGEELPHYITDCGLSSCNPNHGTHVMGTMVGHDDLTGDTTGVALDAEWISAAGIDLTGTSIVDAFEWAADPDGNPNTVDDVPDVINHSWGVNGIGCENIFYDMIDATEALGIVNIFSAGNEGRGLYVDGVYQGMTIRNPANRALDSLDCFAVGNIDATNATPTVYIGSSRGPSDCNEAIKPNVSAPGVAIVSCKPNGVYGTMTGTSMAAPHVSGLVALMRQKNPNATVREIKEAILTSAQDFGHDLPDNDFGWGIIDCMAALNKISAFNADPNVRVYSFDHTPVYPGDTVTGTVVLQNIGADVGSVSASLAGVNPSLTVLQGTAAFGTILERDTVRSGDEISIIVSDTVTGGTILSQSFVIEGAGGYSKVALLYIVVEPGISKSFVTHDLGRMQFTVSNYGTFGMAPGSFYPIGGIGITFEGGENMLYEGGIVIAADLEHVSDGIRNSAGEPDGDFSVLPGGGFEIIEPGYIAPQQTYARFADDRATNPLGLEITQESYAYTGPNDDFIVLRYIIENANHHNIGGIHFGLYLDWDIPYDFYYRDIGGWEFTSQLAWMAFKDFDGTVSDYRGAMVLDETAATAFTGLGSMVYYSGDGFTEVEKYQSLTDGFTTADWYKNSPNDLFQLLAAGPLNLSQGTIDTVAFAIFAGNSLADLESAAQRAQLAYSDIPTDVDDEVPSTLPNGFALSQNYPNPFNPLTTISFVLPRASDYSLTIYNVVGQKVHEVTGHASPGRVNVDWNADGMASGMYLYRVTADDMTASRKMLLLK